MLLAIGHIQQKVSKWPPKNQRLTILLRSTIFCLLRLDRNLYTIPRSPASSACCGNKPTRMRLNIRATLFYFHWTEASYIWERRWPWKDRERQVSTSNAFSPHLRRNHRWVANPFERHPFFFSSFLSTFKRSRCINSSLQRNVSLACVMVQLSWHILIQKLDLKVALVGPGGCGKSALATRILARWFQSRLA